jgi:ribosomal protein L35
MKQSVKQRIRVTGSGKLMRRIMGQNHAKVKKSTQQKRRKAGRRAVNSVDIKTFQKYRSS